MKTKPKEIEKRMKAFSMICRSYGIKTTPQRTEIYRQLILTDEHPDAETVYTRVRKRIPAISLDTVYRTIRLLKKKGLISHVNPLSEKERFDANTDHHHHFVCTECGCMKDLYRKEWNDFRVPSDLMAIGEINSFHIELRGLCKACQRKRHDMK